MNPKHPGGGGSDLPDEPGRAEIPCRNERSAASLTVSPPVHMLTQTPCSAHFGTSYSFVRANRKGLSDKPPPGIACSKRHRMTVRTKRLSEIRRTASSITREGFRPQMPEKYPPVSAKEVRRRKNLHRTKAALRPQRLSAKISSPSLNPFSKSARTAVCTGTACGSSKYTRA